ncbi:geraniol 8-hydroxylase-like [Magnolia sinica]|uniref:geraniol 8-hydroxylase-like n=1 Tax=Magnolia sinica TaxID=86752 RepID=UPI00265A3D6A|nr:geraniol 8-hydroxylase-like [Magnolia sinica]
MEYSTLLLSISTVCTCIYVLFHARERPGADKLPPGPTPLPIVGSLFKLGNKPNESLAELAKTYGPIISLRLGRVLAVAVSSPSMAKEVLQKHDQALSGRPILDAVRALGFYERTMGWQPTNMHWRKLRMMYNTQIFTTQRLDADQALRRQKVQELIDHVCENCLMGRAVDIGRSAFVTTLNLLSNTILSVDLVDLNSESAQEFKDHVHGIMEELGKPNLSDYFPLLRPMDLQGVKRRMAGHFRRLYEIFDGVIEERLQSRASSEYHKRNDLLDVLLDHSQDEDLKLSRSDIKALLVEIFTAGTDTSVTTMEWAMAELLRNPNVMEKARSELMEMISSGHPVEESDIVRLPYVQAIVKETLRIHPPVPLLVPHRAEASVEVCGYTVPKHTQLFVNIWAINRDAKLWPNPTSFLPERFVGSDIDLRGRDFELLPFGAGRRICPGLNLGLRMVHLMLASLIHSFTWKLPNGMAPQDMDMSDKFGITLQMAVPLRVVPMKEN